MEISGSEGAQAHKRGMMAAFVLDGIFRARSCTGPFF
jgi:hypothetical protein